MIGELRDRRIQGTRAEILAALSPLKDDGTVTLSSSIETEMRESKGEQE